MENKSPSRIEAQHNNKSVQQPDHTLTLSIKTAEHRVPRVNRAINLKQSHIQRIYPAAIVLGALLTIAAQLLSGALLLNANHLSTLISANNIAQTSHHQENIHPQIQTSASYSGSTSESPATHASVSTAGLFATTKLSRFGTNTGPEVADNPKLVATSTPEGETSTSLSLDDFVDSNYLNSPSGFNLLELTSMEGEGDESEGLNSLSASSSSSSSNSNRFQSHGTKSKRQAYKSSSHNNLDWWSKLAPSSNKPHSQSKQSSRGVQPTGHQNQPARKYFPRAKGDTTNLVPEFGFKRTVYREQPLKQNAIITIKNQLTAIKSKHRILVTRTVKQLQQLDTRLTESYKLCMKKQQPLYGGMLYRTRDFVVRMAKEVKHESRVLEAMTKQVQNVLRQTMTNRTIVREYNKLIATTTTTTSTTSKPLHNHEIHSEQQTTKIIFTNKLGAGPTRIKKDSTSQSAQNHQEKIDKEVVTLPTNNLFGSKRAKFTPRKPQITALKNPGSSTTHSSSANRERESEATTKRQPIKKYTVSVNEVNLRKELGKTQALIDRINGSYYDLNAVVDDIIHLFKLTSDYTNKRGFSLTGKANKLDKMYAQQQEETMDSTNSARRRLRKMLKSPVRVLLEKYGKLTANAETNSTIDATTATTTVPNTTVINVDTTNTNLPDLKPLFDNPNLSYSESIDADIGFDYIVNEEE